MQLENMPEEVMAPNPEQQNESASAPKEPEAVQVAERVAGQHLVRVWNNDTNKAVEVKRSIDTGSTLDLWI